ncbi:energy transducer TonB [Aureispira anguillae]|uniref:Energy transducer TonB n=1 Tax=Aureispira anguillae TaxID=2864201 RepID=A0A915YC91_9BACT|nr:energy transducer TonB [Aureispira anguillae]BDS10430.1 energy transducer TonB [Aureispira anguillae]
MKPLLLLSSLLLLVLSCSTHKTTSQSNDNPYKNTYDHYLAQGETKIYAWYQGLISKRNTDEYIIRLFYPEKKQITSLITYKSNNKDIKHGAYQTWFDNGNKKEAGAYKNNLRDGGWKFYSHRKGLVTSEGKYKDGELQGKWKNYDSEGNILNEITWVDDVKEGAFVEYDSLGNVINEGIYKADTIFQQTQIKEKEEYQDGTIFAIVEEMPYLRECAHIEDPKERKKTSDQLLLKYIYNTISYPAFARENAAEGKAVICFTVMEDGRIRDVYTISGICESIEKECLKIVNNLPPWNPGKQKGKAVRVKYNLPIRFKLT